MSLEETRKGGPPPAKPRAVIHVVDDCLRRHAKGKWPVSLAATVSQVRLEAPGCDLDDRDLADLIAIRAIEIGCNVIFDADLLGKQPKES